MDGTPEGTSVAAGLLAQGARACLAPEPMPRRTAVALLRLLLDAVERFGRPKMLRTDNEPVFRSPLFRCGLLLLSIRHRPTRPFSPWENRRIERFFGTFKERLRAASRSGWEIADPRQALAEFRAWYNHLRTHQHLDGRTPAEAWNRTEPRPGRRMRLYEAWGGALRGFG